MAAGNITIATIQREVARHYKVPVEAMTAPAPHGTGKVGVNKYGVSHPRQVAMCLAARLTRHSDARIGYFFNRERTTVRHAEIIAPTRRDDREALRILTKRLLFEPGPCV